MYNDPEGDIPLKQIWQKIKEFIKHPLQPTRVNYNFLVRIFEINTKSTS